MQGKHSFVKDRGVKQAPFYVLIGTQMPSILIEASFISNPRECERLLSDNYQNDIADGILNGLKNFIKARESEK